jgi:hypothetical protein
MMNTLARVTKNLKIEIQIHRPVTHHKYPLLTWGAKLKHIFLNYSVISDLFVKNIHKAGIGNVAK